LGAWQRVVVAKTSRVWSEIKVWFRFRLLQLLVELNDVSQHMRSKCGLDSGSCQISNTLEHIIISNTLATHQSVV